MRRTLEEVDGVSTKRSVNVWRALGPDTIAVMDSEEAVQKLMEGGYGSMKVCKNLKEMWDAHRGACRCCLCY